MNYILFILKLDGKAQNLVAIGVQAAHIVGCPFALYLVSVNMLEFVWVQA